MADSDDRQARAQVWGGAVVVGSALAVVAAYLINGAPLVLVVAGIETLLVMVYVGRRWQATHRRPSRAGHRPRRGIPDAAHCERCRRAREALDERQARGRVGAAAGSVLPESAAAVRPGRSRSQAQQARETQQTQQAREAQQVQEAQRARSQHAVGPEPDPEPEPGAADHPPYPRRPQARTGYERPWTAERAATRSTDRTTARRGAPGSAGRAVRHQ
ncbi:hypothetical protein ACFY2K_22420 [Kitasatospora sp. NPDC001309]|uniref:hypothetical protein n=1 Tax=Kitasatospora sp. NPDC001309 TaxID=3364013 RepID=UPI00369B2E3E